MPSDKKRTKKSLIVKNDGPIKENRIVHLNINQLNFSQNSILSFDEDTSYKFPIELKYQPMAVDPSPYAPLTGAFQFNQENDPENLIRCFNEFELEDKPISQVVKDTKSYFQVLKEFSGLDWPIKTRVHCWWCKHSFSEKPLGAPRRYTEEKKGVPRKFHVEGCFCSFECTKSYMIQENNFDMYLLSFLVKVVSGMENVNVTPAPSWKLLQTFGGELTIEDFRKNQKVFSFLTCPLVPIEIYAEDTNSEIKLSVLHKLKKVAPASKKKGIHQFIVDV